MIALPKKSNLPEVIFCVSKSDLIVGIIEFADMIGVKFVALILTLAYTTHHLIEDLSLICKEEFTSIFMGLIILSMFIGIMSEKIGMSMLVGILIGMGTAFLDYWERDLINMRYDITPECIKLRGTAL